jgi:hypothetical protein
MEMGYAVVGKVVCWILLDKKGKIASKKDNPLYCCNLSKVKEDLLEFCGLCACGPPCWAGFALKFPEFDPTEAFEVDDWEDGWVEDFLEKTSRLKCTFGFGKSIEFNLDRIIPGNEKIDEMDNIGAKDSSLRSETPTWLEN